MFMHHSVWFRNCLSLISSHLKHLSESVKDEECSAVLACLRQFLPSDV